ncbi:TMEM165/GDT1 family protein [Caloramator sp. E03]|uniref:TMEM165/GDT1 family protein n=1 Tax=Caloramator sp. E03 TaxID=2576307 RepID=UPI001110822B|nr:TMEM165/GDT1 family protein [Caloramator sp. E03]QCX33599.1 TMEM165/GDT1 family protein [Caloramator sp. E03]
MLKIILTTFILVFIAELGDKTQITTMLLSAEYHSKLSVFIGSSLALVCSSLLGVLLGSIINKYIPPYIIQLASSIAFIIIGILLLFNKI